MDRPGKVTMIHSTKFDKATIQRSRVARRKGNRVRFFDPATARMSGWHKVAAPTAQERAAALNEAAARIDAQQLATVSAAAYASMTVRELFPLARSKFGMRVTTKTRKAELVRMLTSLATKGF